MRFAELDAVTIDGYGTLLTLDNPVAELRAALGRHGVERGTGEVAAAFAAEAAHYRPRSLLGRDGESLVALRLECAGVFLEALGAELQADEFVDDFVRALRFRTVPGAAETLARLRARGLALGVVANWDCALPRHLEALGLRGFSIVVTSADVGVAKPDPAIFRFALERLGVAAGRALHVGDEPADAEGAVAAGMRFAPAPLSSAFAGWE